MFNAQHPGRITQLVWLAIVVIGITGCYSTPAARSRRAKPRPANAGAWVYTTTQEKVEPGTVHLQKAWSYQAGGMLDWALQEFERALAENPSLVKAHLGIGEIYEVRGDYNRAAEAYEGARRIAPRNFDATYKLGLMYQLLDRVEDAVGLYQQALAIEPESPEAHLNLATAYLQLNQAGLALPYAQRATELDPDSRPAFVNLGAIQMALGEYDAAIDAYRGAADRGDMDAHIALSLAEAFIKTNRYPQAVNTLESLIQVQPGAEAYERLGYAHFRMSMFDEALNAYEEALKLNANHVAALNGRGVILMYQYIEGASADATLKEQALAAWRRSVEIKPGQIRIVNLISNFQNL